MDSEYTSAFAHNYKVCRDFFHRPSTHGHSNNNSNTGGRDGDDELSKHCKDLGIPIHSLSFDEMYESGDIVASIIDRYAKKFFAEQVQLGKDSKQIRNAFRDQTPSVCLYMHST